MQNAKRFGHAGVGKLGVKDLVALLASLAGSLGVCSLIHLLVVG